MKNVKVNNLRLFLKLGSIPRNYKEFEERINIGGPEDRSKLHLNIDAKNTFEIFIKENLYKFMPVSYLEGFKKINNYTLKISFNYINIFLGLIKFFIRPFEIFISYWRTFIISKFYKFTIFIYVMLRFFCHNFN